jgi:RNA polymerase sigma-70 factor (ECF subfamily)
LNQEVYDIHRQLVEACKAGDRKAYNELYNSYAKAMYNICYRMMNNTEDARDMLQEGFVDAFRRIESFRFESTFGAWLKKIVINKCINALEKRRVVWEDTEISDESTYESDNESINEEELQLSVEKVKKAMNRLPEGARVVFSLYLLEGYDHTEISEILNISESTSKTQFMRARQMVKEIMLSMPAV